jgi:hypothetical protein
LIASRLDNVSRRLEGFDASRRVERNLWWFLKHKAYKLYIGGYRLLKWHVI